MTFNELESNIKKYLLLADKGIIKLLCATVIANRISSMDPIWLFIVSNSSGGKSEVLTALSRAQGCWEQDDLTSRTFISGTKRSDGTETSLLHRLPPNPIIIIKDLTLLLDKDQRESGAIFSQLRLIYDGKLIKSFGTGEDVKVNIKMGLIAGTTSAIEDTQARQASMGQRTIKYYMKQPDALEVTLLGMRSKKDKEMRLMMGESFKEYLDKPGIIPTELPELPDETIQDVARLSEMATAARSSIKRKEFSRDNPIERRDLREMPVRMAKQLRNLGQAMMILNEGPLTNIDNRILYQIALDSIPSSRKEVMMALTSHSMDLETLSLRLKLPDPSVKIYLDDLIALNIVTRQKGYGNSFAFHLREDYRELISRFEDIPMSNEILVEEDPLPVDSGPGPNERAALERVGLL